MKKIKNPINYTSKDFGGVINRSMRGMTFSGVKGFRSSKRCCNVVRKLSIIGYKVCLKRK